MRNRLEQTKAVLRGNQGSGIVVVLITMLFVMLLGAALLYTSYTSYLVKLTDRAGKSNFYDASTAMNQVMAGIQGKASDAIGDAYTYVLTNYSDVDPAATFQTEFQSRLLQCSYTGTGGVTAALIYSSSGHYVYSPKGLLSFISAPSGAAVTVNGCDGAGGESPGSVTVETGASTSTITLKDVSLTYRNNGYETNVTTDISVDMPDFYQSTAEYTVSGLPDYALVARNGLSSSTIGDNQISGSVYAGNVSVTAGRLTLNNDSTLICADTVGVGGGSSSFWEDASGSLWTKNLAVGNSGTVTLGGNSYVSNDLELNQGSQAILKGDYYGFGTSTSDPEESSAILANGSHATLDLDDAKKLFLAGNSFVSNQASSLGASSILMGESIASKSDQLIYLVPESCLNGGSITSNPQIVAGPVGDLTGQVSLSGDLQTNYGAAVQQLTYPLGGGQFVVYFFMKFDTVEHANAYFRSYFETNPETVDEYLRKYLTIWGEAATLQSRGYTVSGSDSTLKLQDCVAGSMLLATANRLAGFYENLRVNLTTTVTNNPYGATNPYDYYVKSASLPDADSGSVMGCYWYATNGDYTVETGCPYSVIIAGGSVTVNADFTGLILCGGTVYLNASVNAGTFTDDLLSDMSAYMNGYGQSDDDDEDVKQSWNLDKLVYYRNWSKQ